MALFKKGIEELKPKQEQQINKVQHNANIDFFVDGVVRLSPESDESSANNRQSKMHL